MTVKDIAWVTVIVAGWYSLLALVCLALWGTAEAGAWLYVNLFFKG